MNNPTELHRSVCAADVAATRALLEDGHDVDPIEEHGFTPLHKASALEKPERIELVRLLIEHKADVTRGDHEGYTPLHWASALGHSDIMRALARAAEDRARRLPRLCSTLPSPFPQRSEASLFDSFAPVSSLRSS